MTTATDTSRKFDELDYRENDGIQVSLLWSRDDNNLAVLVVDTKTDETFELPARADEAMDVFNHPFAYASRLVATGTGSELTLLPR
jgi:hypothetical protein